VAARLHCPVYTEILPAGAFYLAEGYHQKYYLRQMPDLLAEFSAIYPTSRELAGSTAAARVNGYLAGYGTLAEIRAELDNLGLSPTARRRLMDLVATMERCRSSGLVCPVPRQGAL
jgi:peptide-methionine (S)-S-oxide reductase